MFLQRLIYFPLYFKMISYLTTRLNTTILFSFKTRTVPGKTQALYKYLEIALKVEVKKKTKHKNLRYLQRVIRRAILETKQYKTVRTNFLSFLFKNYIPNFTDPPKSEPLSKASFQVNVKQILIERRGKKELCYLPESH